MPLPNNFSPTEQLQDVILKTVNAEVREWFHDVTADDDLVTPRGTLKIACMHREEDTISATASRLMLFYMVCGSMPGLKGWLAPDHHVLSVAGHPQVILNFVETGKSVKARRMPERHSMRASFRILSERFESAGDEAKIDQLERKIKQQFPTTYRHQTGQTNYAYMDKGKGFQLRIAAFSESDARELARKLISCSIDSGVEFKESNWSRASTKGAVDGQRQTVLGKSVRMAAKRPSAVVALRQADLFIPGWGSRTLLYRNLVD
jgi:hypothetical protein